MSPPAELGSTTSRGRAPGRTSRPKGTLFCPACDHESGIDGDWHREVSATRLRLGCPACGAVVLSQSTLA